MKTANRWLLFGVSVAGLLHGGTPLRAQPASAPTPTESAPAPTGSTPASTGSTPASTGSAPAPTGAAPAPTSGAPAPASLTLAPASVISAPVGNPSSPWNQGVAAQRSQAARALFLEGNHLFKIPLFAQAAEKYIAAIAKWKHPAFYYNLALAQLNLGKEVDARESLEHALEYGAEPLGGADRFQEAQKQLRELERHLGRIHVTCQTKGAVIALDGRPLFTGPGSYQGWAEAKDYELTAKRAGYLSEARRVTVPSGGVRDIELRMITLSEASEASRRWATWKPWAVVTAGGVIAAASGGLHALASRNFKAYDEQFQDLPCAQGPRPPGCTQDELPTDLRDRLERARRQQTIAVGGYIAGGSVIAASFLLLYLNRPRLAEQGASSSSAGSVAIIPEVSGMSGGMFGIQVSVSH